jgi:multidrug efflux pump subunit AcrB
VRLLANVRASDTYVNRMRVLMLKYPEVQSVVSQHGRPDDGTDATGFFNAEFFVPLKPADTWPAGVDKEKLTQDMTNSLTQQFPGVDFNFSQYIQDNVEEAASGVKGENSVKVYGNDLETLEKTADSVAATLAKVPGITDLAVLRSLGQPTIRIDIDRVRAALDQAGALYRSAVLTAFQNVADALHALDTDADALNAASRAEGAAQKSLDVVRHQLELGSVSYLALINAEQTYQQAVISLAQARANRYADTAALFQSLGGSVRPIAAQ